MHVTKDMAIRAILHGACSPPVVGKEISSLPQSNLIWAEERGIISPKEKAAAVLPAWALAKSGYGDGYGDGYGSGDGYELLEELV